MPLTRTLGRKMGNKRLDDTQPICSYCEWAETDCSCGHEVTKKRKIKMGINLAEKKMAIEQGSYLLKKVRELQYIIDKVSDSFQITYCVDGSEFQLSMELPDLEKKCQDFLIESLRA
jgi:hypothetical protein